MFRMIVVGLPGLLLAGCASSPIGLPDPGFYAPASDPQNGVAAEIYTPVVGDYAHRMPASPKGWRGSGVEVAPLKGSSSGEGSDPSASEMSK